MEDIASDCGTTWEQWREEGMTPYAFMLRIVVGRCLGEYSTWLRWSSKMQTVLQWAEEVEHRADSSTFISGTSTVADWFG